MTNREISDDEYVVLQQPAKALLADELYAFQRDRLVTMRLAKPDTFDRFAKRLPSFGLFILVPQQPAAVDKLDWSELMARTECKGKHGKNQLDKQLLKDTIEVPDGPTVLVGVEDGRSRLNIRPKDSHENIRRDGRTAYTVWCGYIHVVLFTEVLLRHHGMDIVGSRYDVEAIPDFYLNGVEPALGCGWVFDSSPVFGAPSCGSVER